MSGFIPIGRELQNHWVRRDKDYWHVFCEMYFLARFSTKPETRVVDGIEITINQREFIFGRSSWSARLDISERRLRTLVKKLVEEGFISQVAKYSKFTIYSFDYTPEMNLKSDQQNDQHSDQQDFEKRPAETQSGQGFPGTSDQQDFGERPAERPAQRPQKEEGIKEEGYKGECLKPMPSEINERIAIELLSYLCQKTGKKFKATRNTLKYILGRLNEGYTKEDCIHVIDVKCAEWIGTSQEKYLDYETLFRPTKFPKYLEQRLDVVTRKQSDVGYKSRAQRNQKELEILNQFYEEGAAREANGCGEVSHDDQDRLSLL